jgi:nucleoside-diphosphate-sugar epimerase
MNIFISGATGYIGSKLAIRLAEAGHNVHAIYRSFPKTKVITHKNIKLFKGDILDAKSIVDAMKGCDQVYHVAAFAKVWEKDPSNIYRMNIEGAMNVVKAAIDERVKKIVVTSTAGVFGPSTEGMADEESVPDFYFIDYEKSKAILEKILLTLATSGTEIVIVNPSRVFGPGIMSESNGVTRMMEKYLRGKWRFIPGNGKSIGNYAFIDDVVDGHILAMEKGRSGERYLLGGDNVSYNEFFFLLTRLSGKKYKLFKMPLFLMLFISQIMLFFARNFGLNPPIIPPLVKKFNMNFELNTKKAKEELSYINTPLKEAIAKTVIWLENVKNPKK